MPTAHLGLGTRVLSDGGSAQQLALLAQIASRSADHDLPIINRTLLMSLGKDSVMLCCRRWVINFDGSSPELIKSTILGVFTIRNTVAKVWKLRVLSADRSSLLPELQMYNV